MTTSRPRFVRHQRRIIVNGILLFVAVIAIIQLWLLTATLNATLGGDDSMIISAMAVSLSCLALNGGLLWYLYRLE